MKRTVCVNTLLSMLMAGCALLGNEHEELAMVRRYQQQWDRQGIDTYEYDLNVACFCPYVGPVRILVRADTAHSITVIETGELVADPLFFDVRTIKDLFAVIERAIKQDADELDVEYDPTLGYPKHISIDYIKEAVDDEIAYTVVSLRPLR